MSETEIRSVLVPVTEAELLVPNASIAEIVGYTTPEPIEPTEPPKPTEPTEPTEPTSRRAESTGPQVVQGAKTSTVALSSDPVERAEQLELMRSYGYDTSAFET